MNNSNITKSPSLVNEIKNIKKSVIVFNKSSTISDDKIILNTIVEDLESRALKNGLSLNKNNFVFVTEDQTNQLFKAIDIDNGGTLSTDEVFKWFTCQLTGLVHSYMQKTHQYIRKIIDHYGTNREVNREAFYYILTQLIYFQRIYRDFKLYSKDFRVNTADLKTFPKLLRQFEGDNFNEKMIILGLNPKIPSTLTQIDQLSYIIVQITIQILKNDIKVENIVGKKQKASLLLSLEKNNQKPYKIENIITEDILAKSKNHNDDKIDINNYSANNQSSSNKQSEELQSNGNNSEEISINTSESDKSKEKNEKLINNKVNQQQYSELKILAEEIDQKQKGKHFSIENFVQLTDSQTNQLFKAIDIDNGGTLSTDEVFKWFTCQLTGLVHSYMQKTHQYIRKIIDHYGTNREVNREAFYNILTQLIYFQRIYRDFKLYSKDFIVSVEDYYTNEKINSQVMGYTIETKLYNFAKDISQIKIITFLDYLMQTTVFINVQIFKHNLNLESLISIEIIRRMIITKDKQQNYFKEKEKDTSYSNLLIESNNNKIVNIEKVEFTQNVQENHYKQIDSKKSVLVKDINQQKNIYQNKKETSKTKNLNQIVECRIDKASENENLNMNNELIEDPNIDKFDNLVNKIQQQVEIDKMVNKTIFEWEQGKEYTKESDIKFEYTNYSIKVNKFQQEQFKKFLKDQILNEVMSKEKEQQKQTYEYSNSKSINLNYNNGIINHIVNLDNNNNQFCYSCNKQLVLCCDNCKKFNGNQL